MVSVRIDNDFEMIYVEALGTDGLKVKFDQETGVLVTLPKDVTNTNGLCGNNDGDATSELLFFFFLFCFFLAHLSRRLTR